MSHRHEQGDAPQSHSHGQPLQENTPDADETAHFNKIINAFRYYKTDMTMRQNKTIADFAKMPKEHQEFVPRFHERMQAYTKAVDVNQAFLESICAPHRLFENSALSTEERTESAIEPALPSDMDKVRTTIKQFVRDWAEEGAEERRMCYQPFLDELAARFGDPADQRHEVYVLVPGCGLGRLALEIARLGFSCQGNEFSYFMLVASNFILNRSERNMFPIHPFVHQPCNNIGVADQARAVMIPDVHPADALLDSRGDFSMSAGDFLECYSDDNNYEAWSAVCTCFFIDTATDVVAYVKTIYSCLEPGGVWINLGPLLWHFADMSQPSMELSLDEVMEVVRKVGFVVEKEERGRQTPYIHNVKSMFNTSYDSVFFVATKPLS